MLSSNEHFIDNIKEKIAIIWELCRETVLFTLRQSVPDSIVRTVEAFLLWANLLSWSFGILLPSWGFQIDSLLFLMGKSKQMTDLNAEMLENYCLFSSKGTCILSKWTLNSGISDISSHQEEKIDSVRWFLSRTPWISIHSLAPTALTCMNLQVPKGILFLPKIYAYRTKEILKCIFIE